MERTFYKKLLAIALPITFQNMIAYSVNMADTLMLGSFGETTLSAVSLAGQVFFMFSLLIGGLASGSSVLCSQYYGRQDLVTLRKVVSIALKISLGLSSLFVLLLLVLPMPVMRLFTLDREVIHQGALYFRVVAVSYLCYGVTTIFLIALRSVQDVKLSLRIYGVSLLINIFF
ncbi:MAG: MATE family efflux transporter, partial [Lachnospiraceae bacterium]